MHYRILEEHRATSSRPNPWFGQDGRLVTEPSPLQRSSTRPPQLLSSEDVARAGGGSEDEEELTFFAYPTLHSVEDAAAASSSIKWSNSTPQCQMDVDVGSILFSHHHLFSLEHHLANKLVEKYNAYQTVRATQALAGLDNRLSILYKAVAELQA